MLYYDETDAYLPFLLYYSVIIISCTDLNDGRVDDRVDDDYPFEFNNVLSLSCKIIRFEAPKRQREREG
jgi:hypothetical protein